MNPQPQPDAPSSADTADTDLLLYAGRLLAIPAGLAEAVLDYAHAVAGQRTAELVTLPILHDGTPHEVRLLIGGSVPVAALFTGQRDGSDPDAVLADLRARTPSPNTASIDTDVEPLRAPEAHWLTHAFSEWD